MISCPRCGQRIGFGQAPLTEAEKDRLPMGNQHTKWNIIRWRAVKGAAEYYGVEDWTAEVDATLSYEENIALMAEKGTESFIGGPSNRELAAQEKEGMRQYE